MLLTYARAFSVTIAELEYSRGVINGLIQAGSSDIIMADTAVGAQTIAALDAINELCGQIPSLNNVCHQIGRIRSSVENGSLPLVLHTDLFSLIHRILDELRQHFYYPVTASNAALYENEMPFGEETYEAFPSARVDIRNAVKCVMFGLSTAAVFHLMRVMEVGLRVLGERLGIPYAPSWESYITQMNAKLSAPHKTRSVIDKRQLPLIREIAGDLTAVKFSWRNPTMHIVREYEPAEVQSITFAVATLMDRMAKAGFKESRKRKASKGTRQA